MIKNYIVFILTFLIMFLLLFIAYTEHYAIENFVPFEVINTNSDLLDLEEMIMHIKGVLEANKIGYWVSRGLLLGVMRHANIIPWIKPVDGEICLDGQDLDKFQNLIQIMRNNKYDYDNYSFHYGKTKVNFFIFGTDGRTYAKIIKSPFDNVNPNEYFTMDEIYPLKKYPFGKDTIYGPNDPTPYLNRIYGKDWKTIGKINEAQFPIDININEKPYLWVYWDNLNGMETPIYISLCKETVIKNCSDSFNIIFLNKDNIVNYVPELTSELMEELNLKSDKLKIAHKVDLYRIMLLYKYGGIYIDADVVVLKDPIEIYNKTKEYDFVGFGCTGTTCNNGYMRPSNWLLASRPYSILMKNVLKELLNKFKTMKADSQKLQYHEVGKMIIWDHLTKLSTSDRYVYYHYPNKFDGSRDKYGKWVTTSRVFSDIPIEYEDEQNMMFMVFYNSTMPSNVKTMSRADLINSNMNISRFYRRALNI